MKTFMNTVECAEAVVKMGVKKANTKPSKVFTLGFMAGMFVGLAYVAYLTATSFVGPAINPVVGKFIGAAIFPTAVILVLLAGASLFTGNNLATLAWMTGDAKLSDVMRNWVFVWLGNFAGSLFLVFVCYMAGIFKSDAMIHATVDLATHKAHMTFTSALFSGFLCNVVVALGVWISFSATDAGGKIIAAWFPIMMFAFSGYQHVVANMFVISMGFVLDPSAFTIGEAFIGNFIPVTIGNALAGGLFIPGIYYMLYLKKDTAAQAVTNKG